MDEFPTTKVRVIGHHGLVASILDKTKLIERIDRLIPKNGHPVNLSHGQAIAAIIINNLSSDKRQLYGLCRFFEEKPIDLYLGPDITAEMINYDVLARSLDAIARYGVTDWFVSLAIPLLLDAGIPFHDIHIDTTSKLLHGKYKKHEGEKLQITYGHSKDHRPDLKQVMMGMATNGDGIPFWMEPLSGNKNDSETLRNTIIKIEKIRESLEIPQNFIYVADAALYSKEYLLSSKFRNSFDWITRVPESIKLAKNLMRADKRYFEWDKTEDNYKLTSQEIEYGGVKQRWIVVRYHKSHYPEVATLEKKIDREEDFLLKKITQIKKKKYHSEKDIKHEIKKLNRNHRLFKFHSEWYQDFQRLPSYNINGEVKMRPAGWRLSVSISRNSEKIEAFKNTKGRFIIGTNILDQSKLSDEEVFAYYRKQSKVEAGFKFIKDSAFMMKDIYLKRPDRIGALLAVITLSLMVQNIGQYWLREHLRKLNLTVPNQMGKQTQSPTLKWVYETMRSVVEVKTSFMGRTSREIHHLKEASKLIIACFGRKAMNIYGFT
jgi:transposase